MLQTFCMLWMVISHQTRAELFDNYAGRLVLHTFISIQLYFTTNHKCVVTSYPACLWGRITTIKFGYFGLHCSREILPKVVWDCTFNTWIATTVEDSSLDICPEFDCSWTNRCCGIPSAAHFVPDEERRNNDGLHELWQWVMMRFYSILPVKIEQLTSWQMPH